MDFTKLQSEVQLEVSDRYRKVWIQTTRFGSIILTLFPIKGDYDIITRKKFSFDKESIIKVCSLISSVFLSLSWEEKYVPIAIITPPKIARTPNVILFGVFFLYSISIIPPDTIDKRMPIIITTILSINVH